MSYAEASPGWRLWLARARENLPQMALAAAIVLAWIVTHSLPSLNGASPGNGTLAGQIAQYPLRLVLPIATPMPSRELAALAEQVPAIDTSSPEGELSQTPEAVAAAQASSSGAFRQAFSDLPGVSRPKTSSGQLIAIDYNLAELEPTPERYDRNDGSLTVRKPLFIDGVSAGSATIRIEEGAQILISTSSVADALGDKASALPNRISGALAKGTGFIPFYELRGAGIAVEYDPVRDRVSLSTPS